MTRKSTNHMVLPQQREQIRLFLNKYPCVKHKDVAEMFCVSKARISEIVRKDDKRSGV